jgi:DNA polymerase-3 subunit gamma/tau
MSYLVLARKWRPQTFSEVVGQDHVTVTLKKAVEKGRLAHAYLFAGPRGCGKTTTARLLAKVINCENPDGAEPCNSCPSCTAVTEGRHLDVIEIDGASNRGIDEIRDLREKIGYAASQGRSKIYIIDEVHMLTPQAFNALLKTLEEPPAHVYLVFATTEPHKVPPTILSRCQRFNFKKLELAEITGQLEKICAEEKIAYDSEALILIGRRAGGSMRDAESLLDQCIPAAGERVDLALVRMVLGLVDAHLVSELLDAVRERDRRKALALVDTVVSSGLDLEEFFLAYIEGLRNLLVLSIDKGATPDWLGLTESEIGTLREINEGFRTEDLLYLFRSAMRSFGELKISNQPRYLLEAAITEASSWDSAVELSELLRKLDRLGEDGPGEPGGSGGAAGARRASGSASLDRRSRTATADDSRGRAETGSNGGDQSAGAPVANEMSSTKTAGTARSGRDASGDGRGPVKSTITSRPPGHDPLARLGGREQWERFISQIRESKLTLGIWLLSAEVKGIEGDKLLLSFSPQHRFASEMVREEKNRRYIESHLERFFGKKLTIATDDSVGARETSTEPREAGAGAGDAQAQGGIPDQPKKMRARGIHPDIERLVADQPVVLRLIEEFDGEVVPNEEYERRSG